MSATVRNPRGDAKIQVPRKPNGEPYFYEMIHDGGNSRTYADTLTDLMTVLIPGYGYLDTEAADIERVIYAVGAQVALQAQICAKTDMSKLTEAENDVLVGSRLEPPTIEQWDTEVPLVLVATYYEPYSEVPAPTGDGEIVWLDPSDEQQFLLTLAESGLISLHRSTEQAS